MGKNIIYCYSGTGNSLEVARTIAGRLGNMHIICMSNNAHDVSLPNAEIIGFVFPVHHWNMPNKVREFVQNVTINPNAYIFAIAACGGYAVNTLNDFNSIIIAKNATLSYSKVHKNVSNYIVAYERFPDPIKQVSKSAIMLTDIIEDIKNRVYRSAPRSNPIKCLQRVLISNAVNKFPQMDTDFIISEQCIVCGICVKVCPAKNIYFENGKPTFQHKCQQCMACIQYCPKEAINYKNKTQKRKRYHHPNVSAEELAKFHDQRL